MLAVLLIIGYWLFLWTYTSAKDCTKPVRNMKILNWKCSESVVYSTASGLLGFAASVLNRKFLLKLDRVVYWICKLFLRDMFGTKESIVSPTLLSLRILTLACKKSNFASSSSDRTFLAEYTRICKSNQETKQINYYSLSERGYVKGQKLVIRKATCATWNTIRKFEQEHQIGVVAPNNSLPQDQSGHRNKEQSKREAPMHANYMLAFHHWIWTSCLARAATETTAAHTTNHNKPGQSQVHDFLE